MAINILPPAEELCNILDYDPETGIFLWKVSRRGTSGVGSVAGRIDNSSYRRIKIGGNYYLAHRLAWKMSYGVDPTDEIDHKNGIRLDNRICNLRKATRSENQRNIAKYNNNKSGFKGVSWDKSRRKWIVAIKNNNKQKTLGRFTDINDAAAAYATAATALHGEFLNLGTKENNNDNDNQQI